MVWSKHEMLMKSQDMREPMTFGYCMASGEVKYSVQPVQTPFVVVIFGA